MSEAQETKDSSTNSQSSTLTKEEIEADLHTNPRYKKFFNRYSDWSLEGFITYYGWFKPFVLDCGKKDIEAEERGIEHQTEWAYDLLMQIQQRKLFELQCQWRAGLITLLDVRTTWDFKYWEKMIQRCPFLSPISEDELDFFQQYIMSSEYDEEDSLYFNWQEYGSMKRLDREPDGPWEYPAWYTYYEQYRGGADWRLMPDVRGEKEAEYLWIFREERDRGKPPIEYKPMDSRPQLSPYDYETMKEFIRLFEPPEMLRCYQAYKREKDITDDEDLDRAILTLKCARTPIPMEPHENWRDAIFAAARYARQVEASRACTWAYTDYFQREQLGLPHEITLNEKEIRQEEEWRTQIADEVRRGRVLNGEPDDWNY
jgi:hypothetical protein